MTQDEDQPIHTPPPESDEHWLEFNPDVRLNPLGKAGRSILAALKWPADWIRTNVVEPNRGPKYYWYHRRYPRALPIDECYIDDEACMYEADLEYQRNKKVDKATLEILRLRRDACYMYYKDDKGFDQMPSEKCKGLEDVFKREELNFFIKYGEMQFNSNVVHAYTKQKHRMIVERRRAKMQEKQEMENI